MLAIREHADDTNRLVYAVYMVGADNWLGGSNPQVVGLNNGSAWGTVNTAYQGCLVNPRATVSSVTLTSTALDSSTQAAKVKKATPFPLSLP